MPPNGPLPRDRTARTSPAPGPRTAADRGMRWGLGRCRPWLLLAAAARGETLTLTRVVPNWLAFPTAPLIGRISEFSMARVTVEDCVDKIPNRFDLVLLAAQRAREISGGAELTIDRDRDKNPV